MEIHVIKITPPNISEKTMQEMKQFFHDAGAYKNKLQAEAEGVDSDDEKAVKAFMERRKQEGMKQAS